MEKDYQGQTIWIIGASSGMGAALARELSLRGASLILSARRYDMLEALNNELGGRHRVIAFDIGDEEATQRAAESLDKIDRVIFMAVIYKPHTKEFKDLSFIHDSLRVNIGGAFNAVHNCMNHFLEQGSGQIALCASLAGYRGLPDGQPYSACKAALISYAESLKVELEDQNIDVKVICPGFVKTPLTDKNKFEMPMLLEVDVAAKEIADGLLSKRFEIIFPRRMGWLMKFIDMLPQPLFFAVSRMMRAQNEHE